MKHPNIFIRLITPLIIVMFVFTSLLFFKHYKESNETERLLQNYYLPITSKTNSTLFQVIELNHIWSQTKKTSSSHQINILKSLRILSSVDKKILDIIALSDHINKNQTESFPTRILLDAKNHVKHIYKNINAHQQVEPDEILYELSIITNRVKQLTHITRSLTGKLYEDTLINKKTRIKYIMSWGLSFVFIFLPVTIYLTRSIETHTRKEQTIKKKLNETLIELNKQALYDELTGLANRRLLYDRISQYLIINQRQKLSGCIFFIDLDDFKDINDSMGHDAGDAVLQSTAKILMSCTRKTDTTARLGGDEFVLLLVNVQDIDAAINMAEKIKSKLNKNIKWKDSSLSISASIGIYYIDNNNDEIETVDSILAKADKALYMQKSKGKNGYSLYKSGKKAP